jgi:hypothetical protein
MAFQKKQDTTKTPASSIEKFMPDESTKKVDAKKYILEDGAQFVWTGGIEQKKNQKGGLVLGEERLCLCQSHKEQIASGDIFNIDDLLKRDQMNQTELREFLTSNMIGKTIFPVNDEAKDMLERERARLASIRRMTI